MRTVMVVAAINFGLVLIAALFPSLVQGANIGIWQVAGAALAVSESTAVYFNGKGRIDDCMTTHVRMTLLLKKTKE